MHDIWRLNSQINLYALNTSQIGAIPPAQESQTTLTAHVMVTRSSNLIDSIDSE